MCCRKCGSMPTKDYGPLGMLCSTCERKPMSIPEFIVFLLFCGIIIGLPVLLVLSLAK